MVHRVGVLYQKKSQTNYESSKLPPFGRNGENGIAEHQLSPNLRPLTISLYDTGMTDNPLEQTATPRRCFRIKMRAVPMVVTRSFPVFHRVTPEAMK
jgi:hypothetical protein